MKASPTIRPCQTLSTTTRWFFAMGSRNRQSGAEGSGSGRNPRNGSGRDPRDSKRRRVWRLSRECSTWVSDAADFYFDDLGDIFYGSNSKGPPAGSRHSSLKELWVDKYKPCSLQQLAVHNKKVEQVKLWFQERLRCPKENFPNNVLVMTGQAGVGKSASVHVIGSHLGATICEWNTPTPTIWQEHVHNQNMRVRYISKLDEFINFIEKISKYGVISVSTTPESNPAVILLIDDLPVANGRFAFERLRHSLLVLVRSSRIPAVILLTDHGKMDSADPTARWSEELQLALESAGACKVGFNPVTNNSIKKVLNRICKQEQCNVTAEHIDLIAKASGGDIRHAITSLQLFCLKVNSPPNSLVTCSKEINGLIDEFSLQFGKDETLSLFHALGKFLHNKRETEVALVQDQDAYGIHWRLCRLPMKMDSPEKVLSQVHGQARHIADFLHENVLDFTNNDVMEDAWCVTSYLSDADLLLSSFRGILAQYNEAESVHQSAAASVAVRGVLFGNSHPSPSRWHSIRRPKIWQVEQSISQNQKAMMASQKCMSPSGFGSTHVSVFTTEFKPLCKWLGQRDSDYEMNREQRPIDEMDLDGMSLAMNEYENYEDEIEDC